MDLLDRIVAMLAESLSKAVMPALVDAQAENRQILLRIERKQRDLIEFTQGSTMALSESIEVIEQRLAGLVSGIAAEKEEATAAFNTLSQRINELTALLANNPTDQDLSRLQALGDGISAATAELGNIVTTPVQVPPEVVETVTEVVDSTDNELTPSEGDLAVVEEGTLEGSDPAVDAPAPTFPEV